MEKIKLNPLTGLRGVAAISVLIGHALDTSFNYGGHAYCEPFSGRVAYFGMSLFFVLSGFVINYNYAPLFAKERFQVAVRKFFAARFARLYPLYVVSLLVMGISQIPSPYFNGLTLLSYATLTQSWFNVELSAFPPDWSLSTEWFFYFLFVPVAVLFRQPQRPMRALAITSVVAIVLLFILCGPLSTVSSAVAQALFWHGPNRSAAGMGWVQYFSPYFRWPEFFVGMLAARAFVMGETASPGLAAVSLIWCAAVIFTPIASGSFLSDILPNFIFAPAIAVVALYCCQNDGWLTRLLSSRPALLAGEISFSIYIWSWAAMRLVETQFGSPAPSALALFNSAIGATLIILVTAVFAYGSFVLIETPGRRWLRRVLDR